MEIELIPHASVVARTGDTTEKAAYNTSFHTPQEISTIVPYITHQNPPWGLYLYSRWIPVIAQSQNMTNHHTVRLSNFVYSELLQCFARWTYSKTLDPVRVEETVDALMSSKAGPVLKECFANERSWFARLDQNSPKDSPLLPREIRSVAELVRKIASSMRAMGGLQHLVEEAKQQEREPELLLILTPWNSLMGPAHEFRIFVPPPVACGNSTGDFKVAAISQYKWHAPTVWSSEFIASSGAELVCQEAQRILEEVVNYASITFDQASLTQLRHYGFTFDILLRLDQSVDREVQAQLVEINPFGAVSGCGSCLFHWIRDARILYGIEKKISVRFTTV